MLNHHFKSLIVSWADATDRPADEENGKSKSISSSKSKKKRKGSTSFSKQNRASKSKKSSEVSNVGHVDGDYWEIEAIEDFRRSKGQKKRGPSVYEFKVKWKGYEERTWEPEENLTEVALIDARRLLNKQAEIELGLDNDDVVLNSDGQDNVGWFENDAVLVEPPTPAKMGSSSETKKLFEDSNWIWSDNGQIVFRTIERISVHDPDARQKVTESRQNGIPVVLTGHVGWAQFAKPWLIPENETPAEMTTNEEAMTATDSIEIKLEKDTLLDSQQEVGTATDSIEIKPEQDNLLDAQQEISKANENSGSPPIDAENPAPSPAVQVEVGSNRDESGHEDWLDLSKPHHVDVAKMIADIGNERVPILKKNYNERDPINSELTLEAFINKCWPTREEINGTVPMRKLPSLYLHQWQFPSSETAQGKLCGAGKNNPLPNHILGEDLLKYWLDKAKWGQDNNYQYLFMGRDGTKSKLHMDKGGLLISIAPIVGTKEVTLVHRSDGASCLYHLDADIDKPDLHRFPMMYNVRAWKSVLKPGEILLMPYGTYHACRNITPCLSYHRFYLDTVNLKGFLESFFDLEAPEMEHDQVIWNVCWELSDRVDKFTEKAENSEDPNVTYEIESAIDALRVLRNIAQEIATREAQKEKQLGKKNVTEEKYQWSRLVGDIDQSIHDFRFRLRKKKPPLFKRRSQKEPVAKLTKNLTSDADEAESFDDDETFDQPVRTSLEGEYRKLPKATKELAGLSISDSTKLVEGDRIRFRWHGRRAAGTVEAIQDLVKAAYLSYDEFPSCHEEYQPIDRLRIHVSGDSIEVSDKDLQNGSRVFHAESGGEEYRAVVQSWRKGTFYLVHVDLDGGPNFVSKQWVTRDCIFERISAADSLVQQKVESESTPKSKMLTSLLDHSAPEIAIQPTILDLENTNPDEPEGNGKSEVNGETMDVDKLEANGETMDVDRLEVGGETTNGKTGEN